MNIDLSDNAETDVVHKPRTGIVNIEYVVKTQKEKICDIINDTDLSGSELECIKRFLKSSQKQNLAKRKALMNVAMKKRDAFRRNQLLKLKNQHIDGYCDGMLADGMLDKKCQKFSRYKNIHGYEFCVTCGTKYWKSLREVPM